MPKVQTIEMESDADRINNSNRIPIQIRERPCKEKARHAGFIDFLIRLSPSYSSKGVLIRNFDNLFEAVSEEKIRCTLIRNISCVGKDVISSLSRLADASGNIFSKLSSFFFFLLELCTSQYHSTNSWWQFFFFHAPLKMHRSNESYYQSSTLNLSN